MSMERRIFFPWRAADAARLRDELMVHVPFTFAFAYFLLGGRALPCHREVHLVGPIIFLPICTRHPTRPPMESVSPLATRRPLGALLSVFALLLVALPAHARQPQPLPMTSHDLSSLDGFQPVTGNWMIVGNVAADRHVDRDISTTPGQGVLVNIPREGARKNIFTGWEHGDIELEFDFMMPKGSNSGVYLQGRYEVQLFDSWGVQRPTFADAGGIYQRWDPSKTGADRGYEGHAPLMNVSRAPGLWQHFKIHFQAPRFDEAGRKTANARMVRVEQNGVIIHENVELTGPTRAAAFEDEVAMGPLMFQGDHGPVAIRNIRYKLYQPEQVSLSNVTFQSVEGVFTAIPDFSALDATTTGSTEGIDWRASGVNNQYALHFAGNLHVPYDGTYQFQLGFDWVTGDPHYMNAAVGAGELDIAGQQVLFHNGKQRTVAGTLELKAGAHPFTLSWFKNKPGRDVSVALFVEGGGTQLQSLNAPGSLAEPRYVPAIFVEPGSEPEIIRGFVRHDGVKKTRTIAVGDPQGVHYVFDSEQAALIEVWKGAFIETTDMWHSRGQEQLAVPRGSVMSFPGAPDVARLSDPNATWPDSVGADYVFKGYELDRNGHPAFHYEMGSFSVEDRLFPEDGGRALIREMTFTGTKAEVVRVRLARASSISPLPGGSFNIGGRSMYLDVLESGGRKPMVRQLLRDSELLLPVALGDGPVTVRYALIW